MLSIESVLLVHQLSRDGVKNKLFESAVVALEAGDVDVALSQSKQLIEADSRDPRALVLAADCFNLYGKEDEGLGPLRAAVAASGQSPVFLLLQAQQLLRLQQHDQSLHCLNDARRQHPGDSGLLLMHFELLCSLRKDAEAKLLVDSSRSQLIGHPQFHSLVVGLHRRLGEHQLALAEAEAWCRQNKCGDALKALADCWFAVGRHDRYVSCLADAAACSVDDANLLALHLQAQLDASTASMPAVLNEIRRVVGEDSIDPGLALVAARVLLAQSDFAQGWSLYERRLSLSPSGLYAPVELVADPCCSCRGKTVLLVAEQGVGDVLFFSRFIPQLVAEADQVVCLVDERLSALFRRCFPALVVATNLRLAQELAGAGHLCLAIGSLPLRYASTPELVQASQGAPVLRPHPALKSYWMQSLSAASLHVGLSLTAGLQVGSYKTLKRSVPFSLVERMLVDSGAVVHDLRHFRPDEMSLPDLHSHPRLTDDIEQLIAFISCLDVLVTADQTNAFLAGMLGVPTLLIVSPNPHFAFMADGSKTPWFESLSIVRSTSWCGWDGVESEVEERFQVLLSQVSREQMPVLS